MRAPLVAIGAALLVSCAPSEDPELACERRLTEAADVIPSENDSFGAEVYAKLDRGGCNTRQLAKLNELIALTRELQALSAANEKAAASGDKAAHSAAFQRLNEAVTELNDLQQGLRADKFQM
jgi:hypothetical protein